MPMFYLPEEPDTYYDEAPSPDALEVPFSPMAICECCYVFDSTWEDSVCAYYACEHDHPVTSLLPPGHVHIADPKEAGRYGFTCEGCGTDYLHFAPVYTYHAED